MGALQTQICYYVCIYKHTVNASYFFTHYVESLQWFNYQKDLKDQVSNTNFTIWKTAMIVGIKQ